MDLENESFLHFFLILFCLQERIILTCGCLNFYGNLKLKFLGNLEVNHRAKCPCHSDLDTQ